MTPDAVRRLALALPGTVEAPHHEAASFRVGGKIFATLPPDGAHLHVLLDEDAVEGFPTADPASGERLHWGARLAGLRVPLRRASAGAVQHMLETAWRRRAPRAVVAAYDAPSPAAPRRKRRS